MSKAVALVAFALLLVAAPARAATPVKIGVGEEPTVAVDAAGTAHVAFNNEYTSETGQPLMYCAWPRGARGCAPRPLTADEASPQAQPPLIQTAAPNTVTIVSARDDGIDSLQSPDGGASWSAPVPFGQGRFFEGAFGPQGMVLSFYGEFRYRPYGAPAETTGEVDIGAQLGVGSAVGVAPDGRPVFVYGAAVPGLRSRTWN